MFARLCGAALLIASSAALAKPERSKLTPDKVEAGGEALHAAPACSGPSCPAPVSTDHAISEKGTAGTKGCSKPAAEPSGGGGTCNDPCRCPPPN